MHKDDAGGANSNNAVGLFEKTSAQLRRIIARLSSKAVYPAEKLTILLSCEVILSLKMSGFGFLNV